MDDVFNLLELLIDRTGLLTSRQSLIAELLAGIKSIEEYEKEWTDTFEIENQINEKYNSIFNRRSFEEILESIRKEMTKDASDDSGEEGTQE